MRFVDDLVALDSIVHFDPLLETGEASPILGINIARNERSIHGTGFLVRMKQALLRELEWLGSFSAVRHWVHDVLSSIPVLP